MEGPAREMNLTDVSERLEKATMEAIHIRDRMAQVADTLRGTRPTDAANKVSTPAPGGLVPLLAHQLNCLENIQNEQRQILNRLADGLCDAPPPSTKVATLGSVSGQMQAREYR